MISQFPVRVCNGATINKHGVFYVVLEDDVVELNAEAVATDHSGSLYIVAGGRMHYHLTCYAGRESAELHLRHKLENEAVKLFDRLEAVQRRLRELRATT